MIAKGRQSLFRKHSSLCLIPVYICIVSSYTYDMSPGYVSAVGSSCEYENVKAKISLVTSQRRIRNSITTRDPTSHRRRWAEFLRGFRSERNPSRPSRTRIHFKVPPRLLDRNGNMAPVTIANLVDIVGNALIQKSDQPMNVSVNMSISYKGSAKLDDELEVTSRLLGQKGSDAGTSVIVSNKATGSSFDRYLIHFRTQSELSASQSGLGCDFLLGSSKFSCPRGKKVMFLLLKHMGLVADDQAQLLEAHCLGGSLLIENGVFAVGVSTGSMSRSSSILKNSSSSSGSSSGVFGSADLYMDLIRKVTKGFAAQNVIGEGGFGTVYKGQLRDGSLVAIKWTKKDQNYKCATAQFNSEIRVLSKIEHLNLVKLYGYLEQIDEKIVVVEYVGYGTLREHLDGTRGDGLELGKLLDIAIDVAHGITYLHTYSELVTGRHPLEPKKGLKERNMARWVSPLVLTVY
ncbi:Calmodulin-binding receptor-like cytoplasmic kinase 1-like protein [Drosera capensis]